jgi:hypothetical protein
MEKGISTRGKMNGKDKKNGLGKEGNGWGGFGRSNREMVDW